VARLTQQTDSFLNGWSCSHRSNRRRCSAASQAAANAQAAANSATWRSRIQSNSEVQAQLARQQAAAEQQKQIKPDSRLSNTARREAQLAQRKTLSGKSPKRVAPPWAW